MFKGFGLEVVEEVGCIIMEDKLGIVGCCNVIGIDVLLVDGFIIDVKDCILIMWGLLLFNELLIFGIVCVIGCIFLGGIGRGGEVDVLL